MIFVFGTVCIDRLRRVPRLPQPGGYVEITEETLILGGEAANTANALHQWGREIVLAGNSLGNGPEAEMLRSLIVEKGLPTNLLEDINPSPEAMAPICDIYVTDDGDRTMFGKGFSRMNPSRPLKDLPWQPGAWFTAEPNMGDRARSAARLAIERGMKPYLMDFIREDDPVVPGSFWQSSTDWVGYRGNAQRNVRWVTDFVEKRRCFAVLSDGPNGLVAGSPDTPVRSYPPFPAPEVVDTTGAGDMFRAGMLLGLDQCWTIGECLRFGAAAGCLKVRSLGGTTYVPTIAEVQDLITANPSVSRHYE